MSIEYRTLRNYAARVNDYQDDDAGSIGDNLVYNQRICYGWGQKIGLAQTNISEPIALPITYDNDNVVPLVSAGGQSTTTGADITAFTLASTRVSATWEDVSSTGFLIRISDNDGNLSTSRYYAFSWLTIGTYASL